MSGPGGRERRRDPKRPDRAAEMAELLGAAKEAFTPLAAALGDMVRSFAEAVMTPPPSARPAPAPEPEVVVAPAVEQPAPAQRATRKTKKKKAAPRPREKAAEKKAPAAPRRRRASRPD